jgi:hypothetical protein
MRVGKLLALLDTVLDNVVQLPLCHLSSRQFLSRPAGFRMPGSFMAILRHQQKCLLGKPIYNIVGLWYIYSIQQQQ